ncbi:MAG: MBL fold metallo-hydrolase [Clostridium sp.]|jgi:metallo-beta-lactamase family protein|nr:MBL fold metallo-hydrolase [Clostridium sp.]
MKIIFSGGAGSVTGSSHLIEVGGHQVLLDCGLYQGADARERGNEEFPFDPAKVDYLVLSHAHIDHSGRIPMLYKKGFKGKIISTSPTYDLCEIMLRDSAYIQEQDAERENRRRRRGRKKLVEPIYTIKDAEAVLKLFDPIDYKEKIQLFEGFQVRFQDAGHMLGSSFVELWMKDKDTEEVKLVFSGDIGNHNIPLMREPHYIEEADILIMESTYGDRLHEPQVNENEKLLELVNSTIKNGGNVIIPSFAVGRTQEILYVLNEFAEAGKLDPMTRVYVDSPLASKATAVFKKNSKYFDRQAQARMDAGDNVLEFPQLFFTDSVDDSKKLNQTEQGLVVISASGMAEAGRIRHHLKHNLWRPESTVIFVGYQAEQTLGRLILDGKEYIKIFGETIAVEARIERMTGLSGHADQAGLIEFVGNFKKRKPRKIFLVHGDDEAQTALSGKLKERGYDVSIPKEGTIVDISSLADVRRPEKTKQIPVKHLKQPDSRKQQIIQQVKEWDFDSLNEEEAINQIRQLLRSEQSKSKKKY